MKSIQAVKIGIWLIISLNIFVTLDAVWVYSHMSVEIKDITVKNTRSIGLSLEMTKLLAQEEMSETDFQNLLENAIKSAENSEESSMLRTIQENYQSAAGGDGQALRLVLNTLHELHANDVQDMVRADNQAAEAARRGTWGIVFLGTVSLIISLLFMKLFKKNIASAVYEIHAVIKAHKSGDYLRRASGTNMPADIREIYDELNGLLDESGKSKKNNTEEDTKE